jgi:hypothetical protein
VVIQTGMRLTAAEREHLLPASALLDKRENGSEA